MSRCLSEELIAMPDELRSLETRLYALEQRVSAIARRHDAALREILAHVRQQSILYSTSIPLRRQDDDGSAVALARAANMALRQGVPFPLVKASSGGI
jgi:hypothetical protein